jgi:hypothetical protein
MKSNNARVTAALFLGFAGGLFAANFSLATASSASTTSDLAKREFMVFLDETKQNFVFGDRFSGHYKRTVTMSDGSTRTIELTPMVHNSMQVVELKDGGHLSYMGLNGTMTSENLLVRLVDVRELKRQLKEQGWPAKLSQ